MHKQITGVSVSISVQQCWTNKRCLNSWEICHHWNTNRLLACYVQLSVCSLCFFCYMHVLLPCMFLYPYRNLYNASATHQSALAIVMSHKTYTLVTVTHCSKSKWPVQACVPPVHSDVSMLLQLRLVTQVSHLTQMFNTVVRLFANVCHQRQTPRSSHIIFIQV